MTDAGGRVLDRSAALDAVAADCCAGADDPAPTTVVGVLVAGRSGLAVAHDGVVAPLRPEPRLRIGSLTKHLVAAFALLLDRDGTLPLCSRLTDTFPEVQPGDDCDWWAVLTHTAGLPSEAGPALWHHGTPLSRAEVRAAAALRLPGPRRRHHYSNLGYALYGEAVHSLTGRPLMAHLHERLLAPLGLTGTTVETPTDGSAQHGWYRSRSTGRLLPELALDLGAAAPAGQLWSTATDCLRWAAALGDPTSLLAPVRDDLLEPRVAAADGSSHALGGRVQRGRHGDELRLLGVMPGYRASLHMRLPSRFPDAGTDAGTSAAVVLADVSKGCDTDALCREALDRATGDDHRPAATPRRAPEAATTSWAVRGQWWLDGYPYTFTPDGDLVHVAAGGAGQSGGGPVATLAVEHTSAQQGAARTVAGMHRGEALTWRRIPAGVRADWAGYPLHPAEAPLLPPTGHPA